MVLLRRVFPSYQHCGGEVGTLGVLGFLYSALHRATLSGGSGGEMLVDLRLDESTLGLQVPADPTLDDGQIGPGLDALDPEQPVELGDALV